VYDARRERVACLPGVALALIALLTAACASTQGGDYAAADLGAEHVQGGEGGMNLDAVRARPEQGWLDRMKSQIALSSLAVTRKRELVLGPLGYAGYGLWWAISKLFVID
jgi:hypothetical protein